MGIWSQAFGLTCAALITFIRGEEVMLSVPHVTHNSQGKCVFPDVLTVELLLPGRNSEWPIHLNRDSAIPLVRSVFLMADSHPGAVEEFQITNDEHDGVQGYHNPISGAAFTVKCTVRGDRRPFFLIEGSVFLEGRKFRITPTSSWRQHAAVFPSHVTAIYSMDEVYDFKAGDSASMTPPNADYIPNIAQRNQTSSRYRRAVTLPATYYLDILPVVDSTLYTRFYNISSGNSTRTINAILDYLGGLFTAISMRLGTLVLEGRTLKIRMIPPVILKSLNQSPYNVTNLENDGGSYKMRANTLLGLFKNWLQNTKNLTAYDHAMFISALDIYGGSDSGIKFNITKGLAYVGSICRDNGDSSSLVEDKGAYESEGVAAHELAHSLGSKHDGENNTCSSIDRFIMSDSSYPETVANVLHPWKFSSCSSNSILNVLKDLEKNETLRQRCLLNATGVEQTEEHTISADQQCKLFYGEQSFVCRGADLPSLDTLCDEFFCRIPGTTFCERMTAATGTCCANQKKCIQGNCVAAKQGECSMSEWCPLGDQQDTVIDGKTCAQLDSTYCYIENVNLKCCDTCRKSWTGQEGCTYGDKQLGCTKDDCGSFFTDGEFKDVPYNFICCHSCKGQCIDRDTLNVTGVTYTCSDYILTRGQTFVCYQKDILQESCCQSCEDARDTTNDGCPWGDRGNCSFLLNKPVGYICPNQTVQSCCYTCAVLRSRLTTVASSTTTTKTTTKASLTTTTKASLTTTTKASLTTTTKGSSITTTKRSSTATTKVSSVATIKTLSATTKTATITKDPTTTVKASCDPSKTARCDGSVSVIGVHILCVLTVVHFFFIKWLSS